MPVVKVISRYWDKGHIRSTKFIELEEVSTWSLFPGYMNSGYWNPGIDPFVRIEGKMQQSDIENSLQRIMFSDVSKYQVAFPALSQTCMVNF